MRQCGLKARDLFNAVSRDNKTRLKQITQHHGNDPRVMNYITGDKQATALIKASKNGHVEVVNQLLHTLADTDKRSTMNHMNTYGLTALKIALLRIQKKGPHIQRSAIH